MQQPRNKWLALTVTSLGTFASSMNNSSVNVANPILASVFGITLGEVQWVVSIYAIIMCSLMVLMGRLGDRVSTHRIYLTGVVIFTAGSLACGLSQTFSALLVARAVQAFGGSMMIATAMALVSNIFPVEQRGMALGINILMVGLGSFSGPTIAGFILSFAPWQWIFFINVPITAIVLVMGLLWLRSPVEPQTGIGIDYLGSLLMMIAVAALIIFMSGSVEPAWAFLVAAIVIGALFVWHELHCASPLLALELFGNKRFTYGNLISFCMYLGSHMIMFLLPFFLTELWHLPVEQVGLLLVVQSIAMAVMGPVAGTLSDRIGAMRLMPWALRVCLLALIIMLLADESVNLLIFIVALALMGLGMGMLNTPNNSEIMSAAGREYAGYASGFIGTNRQLAFSLSNGMAAGLFSLFFALTTPGMGEAAAYVFSFRLIIIIALALCLTSLALYHVTKRHLKEHPVQPDEVIKIK